MLNLPQLILNLRPDLRQRFGFHLPSNREQFLAWLVTNGSREYAALHCDVEFSRLLAADGRLGLPHFLQYLVWSARPDLQTAFPLPEGRNDFLLWFYTHGVEECGYWPYLSGEEQAVVRSLPAPWPERHRSVTAQVAPQASLSIKQRPFGVNVIGYAYGQLGIGEDARMAARALLAANVPMTMIDFPPGRDVPQNDHSMSPHVTASGEYAVNLICMTAEEHGRYYAERGDSQLRGRYNIGYWPWELSRWPAEWEILLSLVDEVWVSTRHTYDALVPVCDKPLRLMPMAVEIGEVTQFSSRHAARAHFQLPLDATLFCFSFDLKSSFARKNPQACLEAFLQAFPANQFSAAQVGLVIKVHKPIERNHAWERLQRMAKRDGRVHLIVDTLPRADLLSLYQACDCFISLHRAEGFGRGLAEALQLGLHLIATGYSGNMDFCSGPQVDLVRYRLIDVGADEYPHALGQQWAEPDVGHAAALMRRFAERDHRRAPPSDWSRFSPHTVGSLYKQCLLSVTQEN